MNLIVATRLEGMHVRMDVDGKWQYGDALNLAYLIKAAAARAGVTQALVDLRRVRQTQDVQGRFLICDRLRRALAAPMRIALVSGADLVDDGEVPAGEDGAGVEIAWFPLEGTALRWLRR